MISFSKEQVYIVTGASSGIGKAVAQLLNKLGATTIAIARNIERLNELKRTCKNPENMHIEVKDLTSDIEGLPQYVKSLKEKYGKFSGMAYCAGVTGLVPAKIMTYEYAKSVFDINYFAPLLMTKGVIDKRNNTGENVSMVYISSIAAKLSDKGHSVYSGTKSALCASMSSIAKECFGGGIRINCLLPSVIQTPMTEKAMNEEYQTIIKDNYPFGFGEPDDIANMVIYLLSDKSNAITGQSYIIDSGFNY